MGILNNTVSICQFQVVGTPPATDLAAWVGDNLARVGFRSIEQGSAELSCGWAELDDFQASAFASPQSFHRERYFTFSLRRDQRKLPSALLKPYLKKAEEDWLAVNPKFRRVPKQQRDELRDAVRGSLFARTLPVPAVFDAVWDTRHNLVTFASLGSKAIELFVDQFKKSFDGLRLVPVHPLARATRVIDEDLRPALAAADASGGGAVLEQISANRWLGQDFLLWLMHQTMTEASEYRVSQTGPAAAGESFIAYLNDRLQLSASQASGVQKVTVSGPQDHFTEVRTALQGGKAICEAGLYLEKQEKQWKLTLKGETFHFASFKAPAVKLEKDEITEPALEREAVFYERMYLLEEGLQLFDSLLAAFLRQRLSSGWAVQERAIRNALAT